MKRNKGFTLIELLVVIAIIAIIAAILFPVFAQAREKARQITCVSNEKQMGLAMLQYVQDFDEHYPQSQYFDAAGQPHNWQSVTYPYVKNGQNSNGTAAAPIYNGLGGIWGCPSFPSVQIGEYGINDAICPGGTGAADNPQPNTVSESQIDSVASKVLVAEKGQGSTGSGPPILTTYEYYWVDYMLNGGTEDNPILNTTPVAKDLVNNYDHDEAIGSTTDNAVAPGPPTFPRYRHNGLTNCLFADGHVKSMPKGRLSGVGWYTYIYVRGLCPSGPLY